MKFFVVFLAVVCMVIAAQAKVLNSSGVTCAQKKTIVDMHNQRRLWIANGTFILSQPKANNMQKLVWDDALEQVAQNFANQMTFNHNPNPQDPLKRWTALGENIGYGTAPKFDFTMTINLWFDEYKKYTYGPMLTAADFACGHYTQVVWAKTKYIGCGASYFTGDNGKNYKLYVCNYGPSGNYVGAKPYYRGAGCDNLCCEEQCNVPLYGSCTAQLVTTTPSPATTSYMSRDS